MANPFLDLLSGLLPEVRPSGAMSLIGNAGPIGPASAPIAPKAATPAKNLLQTNEGASPFPKMELGGDAPPAAPAASDRQQQNLRQANEGASPFPKPTFGADPPAETQQQTAEPGSTRRENALDYADLAPDAFGFVSGDENTLTMIGDELPPESPGVAGARMQAAERIAGREQSLRQIDEAMNNSELEKKMLELQQMRLPSRLELREMQKFVRDSTRRGQLNPYQELRQAITSGSYVVVNSVFDRNDVNGRPIDEFELQRLGIKKITTEDYARFQAADSAFQMIETAYRNEAAQQRVAMEQASLDADRKAIEGLPALPTPEAAAADRASFEQAKIDEAVMEQQQKHVDEENKDREARRKQLAAKMKEETLSGLRDEEELAERLAEVDQEIKALNVMGKKTPEHKQDIEDLMEEREQLLEYRKKFQELSPVAPAGGGSPALADQADNDLRAELQRLLAGD